METMEEFKIRENGFDEIRKALLIKRIPILILAGGGGIIISLYKTDEQQSTITVLPFVIPIVLGAMSVGLYIGLKRQRKLFESYTLIVGSDFIKREQLNTPTIVLQKTEIKDIIKAKNGAIIIKGNNAGEVIGIPNEIADKEKLEQLLDAIKPIVYKPSLPVFQR